MTNTQRCGHHAPTLLTGPGTPPASECVLRPGHSGSHTNDDATRWWPTPETTHTYLSTGCLHGQHGYCQGTVGQTGAKIPARCKFCQTACICSCHEAKRLSINEISSDQLDDLYEELARAHAEINRLTTAEADDIAAGSYAGRVTELEQHLAAEQAELAQARADLKHRDTIIRNLEAGLAAERAAIARVKDLVAEMRTLALPHSQLGRYVDRTLTALDESAAP